VKGWQLLTVLLVLDGNMPVSRLITEYFALAGGSGVFSGSSRLRAAHDSQARSWLLRGRLFCRIGL
jgi:hypothetical protein